MKTRVCVGDFESWPSREGRSRIFESTVFAVEYEKKNGVTKCTTKNGVCFRIRDVVADDRVNLHAKVRDRLCESMIECAKRKDIITLDVDFADFFTMCNQFIVDNGGIYIAHCWENDARMLLDTQNFLGGRVIKQKYMQFMDSDKGTYDKNHASIVKVCSERVLKERAPRFKRNFHRHIDSGSGAISMTYRGYYPSNLEAYAKASNPDHEQRHTSVNDTLDLIKVLSSAISDDGIGIIGDCSYYYQSKNFERPASNPVV